MSLTTRTLPCGPDPVKVISQIVTATNAVKCNSRVATRKQRKHIRFLSYSVGIALDDPRPCCQRHAGTTIRVLSKANLRRFRRLEREGWWPDRLDELHAAHPDIYLDPDSPHRIREIKQ